MIFYAMFCLLQWKHLFIVPLDYMAGKVIFSHFKNKATA